MRRLALIVANDSYQDPALATLLAPRHDAQALRELLRDPEVGRFEPADLLINESKAEIERAMERMFRRAEPGDLALLYFSGHGIRSRHGRLHLAVTNTDRALLAATSVSASFVKELIDESDAASTVVLLDCCYSGAFSEAGVKADPDLDVGRALEAGRGTFVLTASTAVETAGDGGSAPGRVLSAFTEGIVRGLATGAADVRGVGRISPGDLWEYVRREVPSRTQRQTPTQYGYVEEDVELAYVRRGLPGFAAPVGRRVHLGDLLGPLTQTPDQGLRADECPGAGRLAVPIGQVFRGSEPAEPVWLDLAGRDGHVLVVGRMGSGKSTLLRALIGALCLTHSPDEVRFYFLESGGNKLGSLSRLPFVAGVARDDEKDRVRELLDRVEDLVRQRKKLYGEHFIDSASRFRLDRRNLPGHPHPDVFLVVDRWADFAEHAPRVIALADAGLDYGVHVVAAARSWRDVPDDLQDLMQCHLELNLRRADESRIDPHLAEQAAMDGPGWALRRGGRFLTALPRLDPVARAGDAPVDDSSDGAMDLVARVVSAWRGSTARPVPGDRPGAGTSSAATPSPARLLGVDQLRAADVAALRAATRPADRLAVPIGLDHLGAPLVLDLKEAAQGGMGPHGLLLGATGSGKTELIRSLVTALALRHPPTEVTFLLVDYKGGSGLTPIAGLPHVAGAVGDLTDRRVVNRLGAAITGELKRRQEVLRGAGLVSVRDYGRAAGEPAEPLPALVIVIEEFGGLLTAEPAFIEVLVQVGRLGRSLGVHLLLAGQRLEEGRLRGLDTHLSYRIAMRTFSAMESRAAIGVPDAYELPRSPGHAFLSVGPEPPRQFRAAAAHREPWPGDPGGRVSVAEAVVQLLAATDRPARPVWLPPLDTSRTLSQALRDIAAGGDPALRVPLADVDLPYEQRREVWCLSPSEPEGNLAVVGGPRSGKSTVLQTLVMGLARTRTPADVHVYALDLAGGALAVLGGLPHVGDVAGRDDPELVRRIVGDLSARLDAPDGAAARTVLLLDGWAGLTRDFEDLVPAVTDLIARGPAHGLTVAVTAAHLGEIPASFASWLELRLDDPDRSAVSPRRAADVPFGEPGAGLTAAGDELRTLLPSGDELALRVREMAETADGPRAPRIPRLPGCVPYAGLNLDASTGLNLPIGIAEQDLSVVGIDFAGDPHFLLFGDAECGKSSFLRALATSVMRRFTPEQAMIILVDHRRSLIGLPESEHRIGYGVQAPQTHDLMQTVAGAVQGRLPGPDVTAQQLRERSWWQGPELFVLVDDYDLVASGPTNPLAPLLEYLPQARDIGLHLVITRRIGGAGRAFYEPILQRLRELSTATMIMSGSPEEGPLIGSIKPTPLPPGRGRLITRREGARLVQLAYLEENGP
jgi:S-DNA-T family DNA segregation ATPase FtsK/SpoIIIE